MILKCFFIKDDEFLEKYKEIWGNVSNNIKKEFDSEPVNNKKYLNTKINLTRKKSTQIFTKINSQRRFSMYFFISNFDRFCF